MEITLNGESRTIPAGTTVARLLTDLKLQPKFLAVERNLELVPRTRHAECILSDGDRLEIVTLVGGG
jgi:thiamine biosynthesis protein ThiS